MSRTKRYTSNAACVHAFAQLNGESGKANNVSFRDNVLYSYSTPIAALHTNDTDRRLVIITNRTYSVTTSGKHMPSSSDFHGVDVIYAPSVGVDGGWELCGRGGHGLSWSQHDKSWVTSNMVILAREINDLETTLIRARTPNNKRWAAAQIYEKSKAIRTLQGVLLNHTR